MSVSVYTVANDRFFPGLLGLVCSLRVNGHDGPIVVVDTGLTPAQVELLSQETVVLRAPEAASLYVKPFGPLEQPDDVMFLIDADMLCVRRLDELAERVAAGTILAVEDIGRPGYSNATWTAWGERLGLAVSEPHVYVNGGFFALPRETGSSFFRAFAEALAKIDPGETHVDATRLDFDLPFFFLDQDIANALLASPPYRDSTDVLPYGAAPHAPFPGVRVAEGLSCVDGAGERPWFLHHALQKPWLEPMPNNPYTQLLVEYLHHPDAPTFDDRQLPLFLRDGSLAAATRSIRSARGHVRFRVRGRLGLRPVLVRHARRLHRLHRQEARAH
jgi:hypothetical protein